MPPKVKRPDAVSEKKVRLYATLDEAWRAAESRFAPPKATWGSPTLDGLTGGFRRGDLAVLAGFHRQGKTAFCIHAALGAARAGKRVAYATLDSERSTLLLRMGGAAAHWDIRGWWEGRITPQQLEQIRQKTPFPPGLFLYFHDDALAGAGGVLASCEALKEEKGLDLLVIDGLRPLLRDGGNETDEKRALKELIILLKVWARDLGCQVLATLPMGEEIGSPIGPGIAVTSLTLWEMGLPESAVDLIMTIDLNRAPEHLSAPDHVQVAVLKNRYGPVQIYRIGFDRRSCALTGVEGPSGSPMSY